MQTFQEFIESVSKVSFFRGENSPNAPAAKLNRLAGKIADNIKTGNTDLESTKAYVLKKVGNDPQNFEYVMELIDFHLNH